MNSKQDTAKMKENLPLFINQVARALAERNKAEEQVTQAKAVLQARLSTPLSADREQLWDFVDSSTAMAQALQRFIKAQKNVSEAWDGYNRLQEAIVASQTAKKLVWVEQIYADGEVFRYDLYQDGKLVADIRSGWVAMTDWIVYVTGASKKSGVGFRTVKGAKEFAEKLFS